MTPTFEQSFKKRLQLIAKDRKLTPAEVWQNVVAERFLVRLSVSPYHSHFILKGGTLLAKHIELGRETQDLDFSIQCLSNEIRSLQKVFEEIVKTEASDGFLFANPRVSPLAHFHMQYPGAHVRIEAHFGKSRFPLFIDLGFGDLVTVQEQKILLLSTANSPLFEQSILLKCYPIEFVFAEKLETVIYRGTNNTRMKDFHDLYTLILAEGILKAEEVITAIRAVFSHRKTALRLPIQFNELGLKALQSYWMRYHRTAKTADRLPNQIVQVITVINQWLEKYAFVSKQ